MVKVELTLRRETERERGAWRTNLLDFVLMDLIDDFKAEDALALVSIVSTK